MQRIAASHGWRISVRSLQIAAAATLAGGRFAGAWLRVRRAGDAALARSAGRVLVELCTRLGATFIKVGQIASTRADLLPGPLIAELATLQDRVPPFPFDVAAHGRVGTGAAGGDLRAVRRAPVAAPCGAGNRAANAGDVVAVKVWRPDIVDKVRLDRSILLAVARVLERPVPSLRLVSSKVRCAPLRCGR
jgi:ubiquinone biosynthesis protein